MSGLVHKVFFPGVAPYLQAKALQMPFPEKFKTMLGRNVLAATVSLLVCTCQWQCMVDEGSRQNAVCPGSSGSWGNSV